LGSLPGPTTIKARITRTRISPKPTPGNMGNRLPQQAGKGQSELAVQPSVSVFLRGSLNNTLNGFCRVMGNALWCVSGFFRVTFLILEALAETRDPARKIAHDGRNLAPPAKQQEREGNHNQNLPDTR
jgi:hypothetical protein